MMDEIEFGKFHSLECDTLAESENFWETLAKARAEATKRGIKANSIVINKNMVHVPEGFAQWPEMICGLRCFFTGSELPDGYCFSLQYAPSLGQKPKVRPLEEWHEDYGDVLWWKFPVEEPPYVGSPLDAAWPGYHTHWTEIVCPEPPEGVVVP